MAMVIRKISAENDFESLVNFKFLEKYERTQQIGKRFQITDAVWVGD